MRASLLPWVLVLPALIVMIGAGSGQERKTIRESSGDAAVGKRLFSDPLLSSNGEVSCATCHDPRKNWTSGGLPPKLGGGKLGRRAPGILDRAGGSHYFWDGRESTLEGQARQVLTNPDEMGRQTVGDVLRRVQASGRYPTVRTEEDLVEAIAAYERTLRSPRNRHDEHLSGVNTNEKMSESELRGWDLFRGEALCYKCHTGPNFTDEKFHNTGVGFEYDSKTRTHYTYDVGRYAVTKDRKDFGAFKTPGLRGCRSAAPYMHDASIKTLEEIVEFYDRGGNYNSKLDPEMKPLRLNRRQKADLLAFLRSL